MAYSVLSVITLLGSGFLIDKFTSRKLLIYMNLPLLLSMIALFTPLRCICFATSISCFIALLILFRVP